MSTISLQNDREKIEFLIYLKQKYPGMFSGAATFDTDLLALLDKQVTIEKALDEREDFLELYKKFRDDHSYIKIDTRAEGMITLTNRKINGERITEFKDGLVKELEGIDRDIESHLIERYEKTLRSSVSLRPDGMMMGMIQSLNIDSEQKKDLFKLPFHEKVAQIKKLIDPNAAVSSSFNLHTYALPADLTQGKLIDLIDRASQESAELSRVHAILVAAQDDKGNFPNAKSEWIEKVKKLNESHFDYFNDAEAYKARIGTVNKKFLSPITATEKTAQNALLNRTQTAFDQLYDISKQEAVKVSSHLKLVELPPRAGIMRSCLGGSHVGGDCATSNSFAYADSPVEREYQILNEANKVHGTVSGTFVKTPDGKRGFYVHTISGRPITAQDTQVLLDTLAHQGKTIGFDHLLIPEQGRLGSLLNFPSVREVVKQHSVAGKRVSIEYYDREVRDFLGTHVVSTSYDSWQANTHAVIYHNPSDYLKIETTKVDYHDFVAPELKKQDLMLFATDLLQIEQTSSAIRVAKVGSIDLKEVVALHQALKNTQLHDTKTYLAEIEAQLKKSEIEMGEHFVDDHLYYFYKGLMNAPDAFSPENTERTVKSINAQIILDEEEANGAAALDDEFVKYLAKHKESLKIRKDFTDEYRRLLKGDKYDIKAFLQINAIMEDHSERMAKYLVKTSMDAKALNRSLDLSEISSAKAELAKIIDPNLKNLSEKEIEHYIGLRMEMLASENGAQMIESLTSMKNAYHLIPNGEVAFESAINEVGNGLVDRYTREILSGKVANGADGLAKLEKLMKPETFQKGLHDSIAAVANGSWYGYANEYSLDYFSHLNHQLAQVTVSSETADAVLKARGQLVNDYVRNTLKPSGSGNYDSVAKKAFAKLHEFSGDAKVYHADVANAFNQDHTLALGTVHKEQKQFSVAEKLNTVLESLPEDEKPIFRAAIKEKAQAGIKDILTDFNRREYDQTGKAHLTLLKSLVEEKHLVQSAIEHLSLMTGGATRNERARELAKVISEHLENFVEGSSREEVSKLALDLEKNMLKTHDLELVLQSTKLYQQLEALKPKFSQVEVPSLGSVLNKNASHYFTDNQTVRIIHHYGGGSQPWEQDPSKLKNHFMYDSKAKFFAGYSPTGYPDVSSRNTSELYEIFFDHLKELSPHQQQTLVDNYEELMTMRSQDMDHQFKMLENHEKYRAQYQDRLKFKISGDADLHQLKVQIYHEGFGNWGHFPRWEDIFKLENTSLEEIMHMFPRWSDFKESQAGTAAKQAGEYLRHLREYVNAHPQKFFEATTRTKATYLDRLMSLTDNYKWPLPEKVKLYQEATQWMGSVPTSELKEFSRLRSSYIHTGWPDSKAFAEMMTSPEVSLQTKKYFLENIVNFPGDLRQKLHMLLGDIPEHFPNELKEDFYRLRKKAFDRIMGQTAILDSLYGVDFKTLIAAIHDPSIPEAYRLSASYEPKLQHMAEEYTKKHSKLFSRDPPSYQNAFVFSDVKPAQVKPASVVAAEVEIPREARKVTTVYKVTEGAGHCVRKFRTFLDKMLEKTGLY